MHGQTKIMFKLNNNVLEVIGDFNTFILRLLEDKTFNTDLKKNRHLYT